jgi:hypothetical protein
VLEVRPCDTTRPFGAASDKDDAATLVDALREGNPDPDLTIDAGRVKGARGGGMAVLSLFALVGITEEEEEEPTVLVEEPTVLVQEAET